MPNQTTLKLLICCAIHDAIEKWFFEQNKSSHGTFTSLSENQRIEFMRRNLDGDAFGYWMMGVAAQALIPAYL
jgi:hypothetical protein